MDQSHFDITAVLPGESRYYEMFQAMKQVEPVYPWFTVTTENNLDRSLFEHGDRAVVFFGLLPPWVPLHTEAKICLYFMGYATDRHADCEEEFIYFNKWKALARRADLVFARDENQRRRLQEYSQAIYVVRPGFYHPLVMGTPNFNRAEEIVLGRKYGVISVGSESGRRLRVLERLRKSAAGKSFTNFLQVSRQDRTRLYNSAHAVLHIRKCDDDMTTDPFFASEMMPTTAAMMFEDQVTHMMDRDHNGEAFQVLDQLEFSKSMAFEYISMYATNPHNGHKMAKKAFIKFADHVLHIHHTANDIVRYCMRD